MSEETLIVNAKHKPAQVTPTKEVLEMGQIHLEGNVIPHAWYENIRFQNGKADLVSITLLSEILYWYRPTVKKDELTGKVVSIVKRFHGDALQRSKQSFADQFGFTERQVKESLARLEELGLITRDYRTITSANGVKSGNVLYILIHPEKIKHISYVQCHTYDVQTSEGRLSNVIGMTSKRQTNTETTTKTTTEIPNSSLKVQTSKAPNGDMPAEAVEVKKHRRLIRPDGHTLEVIETEQKMISSMQAVKPDYKTNTQKVMAIQHEIDLMIRIDGRDPKKILDVFRWAINDSFWQDKMFKPNPAKYLREKFDQLEMKMNAKPEKIKKDFCPSSDDAKTRQCAEDMMKGAL